MSSSDLTDTVLRAITDDGALRVIAARTSDTVAEAVRRQRLEGEPARLLGELLTGAILVRETMAPGQRLQALVHGGNRSGMIVADTYPDGSTRGLYTPSPDHDSIQLSGGTLELMRTLYNGEVHRGMVQIPPEGAVSAALMAYLATSEQVTSMLALGTVYEGDRLVGAGGYLVQLLPELECGPLAIMTERLTDFVNIDKLLADSNADPTRLVEEILYGMPFTLLDQSGVEFSCPCSPIRVLSSLATLGKKEIASMIEDGEVLEVICEYCGRDCSVSPNQLTALLDDT